MPYLTQYGIPNNEIYFTFIPAAVINSLNRDEKANNARTLPNQIIAIQPIFFHHGDETV